MIFVSENDTSMSTLEAFHIYILEKITLGINLEIFEMMRHIKFKKKNLEQFQIYRKITKLVQKVSIYPLESFPRW